MLKPTWSVARIMADIAILAVGLTALPALCSWRNDVGVGVLEMFLALILTLVTDRALFGRRHRAFWLGFTAAGWLCAALALAHLQETRRYLLEHGPPLVRAREDFQRQHIAVHMAELQGIKLVPPQLSEWYLLCSLFAELGLGLVLGSLVASAGGLFAAAVALVASQAGRLAHRSRHVAAHGSADPGMAIDSRQ
jgi:MFS family permease